MTTSTSTPQSYRDLLQERANGRPIDEIILHRWRREEQLLRSAIAFPKTYRDIGLVPAHFEAPIHSKLWQAYLNICQRQGFDGSINEPELIAELCEVDEDLGGNRSRNYLSYLFIESAVDPKYGLPVLAKELFLAHRNRRIRATLDELAARVDNDKDIAGLQADYVRTAANIVYDAQGEAMTSLPLDSYEWDPRSSPAASLVKIGIGPIDRYAAGGHGRGDMLVIGAGTNVGKSYAVQAMLRAQATLKQRALTISCEDPFELMYCRTVASFSEPPVSPAAVRQRLADPAIVEAAIQKMKANYDGNIFQVICKKPTVEQVCAQIRTHRFSKDVDLVIVDYLQAITTSEPNSNKTQEMAYVTSELKRTAYQCGVALVVLSQLAREQYRDNTEPNINACKYCGDIENEAEIMVLMWKDADGVLHAKLPKIKWAAAQNIRFLVPVHAVTGCHGEWSVDTSTVEAKDK